MPCPVVLSCSIAACRLGLLDPSVGVTQNDFRASGGPSLVRSTSSRFVQGKNCLEQCRSVVFRGLEMVSASTSRARKAERRGRTKMNRALNSKLLTMANSPMSAGPRTTHAIVKPPLPPERRLPNLGPAARYAPPQSSHHVMPINKKHRLV